MLEVLVYVTKIDHLFHRETLKWARVIKWHLNSLRHCQSCQMASEWACLLKHNTVFTQWEGKSIVQIGLWPGGHWKIVIVECFITQINAERTFINKKVWSIIPHLYSFKCFHLGAARYSLILSCCPISSSALRKAPNSVTKRDKEYSVILWHSFAMTVVRLTMNIDKNKWKKLNNEETILKEKDSLFNFMHLPCQNQVSPYTPDKTQEADSWREGYSSFSNTNLVISIYPQGLCSAKIVIHRSHHLYQCKYWVWLLNILTGTKTITSQLLDTTAYINYTVKVISTFELFIYCKYLEWCVILPTWLCY